MSAALAQIVTLTDATTEQSVLETLVEVAARVCHGQFSVALVVGPDGSTSAIAHRGMAAADVAKLPHLPRALGLVGHVLEGNLLRLADLSTHPRAVGLPPGHVRMKALLAVPLTVSGRVLGGLWLTREPDGGEFSAKDEACLLSIAQQAGWVIANLRRGLASHQLLRNLELADGSGRTSPNGTTVAGSPVVRRLVASTRSMLDMQMAFLTRIVGERQSFEVIDAVSGAPFVTEGTEVDLGDGYCHLMLDDHIPHSVPNLRINAVTASMPLTAAIGAGSYCGVPVHLDDGSLYGTLCGLDREESVGLTAAGLQALETMASLMGRQLSDELGQQRDLESRRQYFDRLLDGSDSWVVVQPITSLVTGAAAGFESLSRFREHSGAPRHTEEVFAEAARVNRSRTLEHVSARAALKLLDRLPVGTYLSVNLSPRTVLDPATYALFAEHPGHQLVIELTEQEHVADYPAVLKALARLRARGARLAIDDVGSGFAGLQHLAKLAPDIVKLDMSFVRDIDTDPSRRAVARAVIGFAAEVGASLVAEGIETPAELTVLRDLGATHGQGYLLGRPLLPDTYLHPPKGSVDARRLTA